MLNRVLTKQIIGIIYKVHSQLGPGLLEKPYHRALEFELRKQGYWVESKKKYYVRYDGFIVGEYYTDLVVNNEVIIEVKSVKDFCSDMYSQVYNYLNITGCPVGLLVNFRKASAEIRRLELKGVRDDSVKSWIYNS